MLTQTDHAVIKKAYAAFKAGIRQWSAPDFGGNLSTQEIASLRPELVKSIQHAYILAEKIVSVGKKFGAVPFTQWVSERYDKFVLDPKKWDKKRSWKKHGDKLKVAIKHSKVPDVRRLIANPPSSTTNSWHNHVYFVLLMMAVDLERAPIVELLLPHSDPKTRNSWVLQKASIKDHAQLMDVLYDVCEPLKALEALRAEHPNDYSKWQPLEQRIEANRLRDVLTQHIDSTPTHMTRKM